MWDHSALPGVRVISVTLTPGPLDIKCNLWVVIRSDVVPVSPRVLECNPVHPSAWKCFSGQIKNHYVSIPGKSGILSILHQSEGEGSQPVRSISSQILISTALVCTFLAPDNGLTPSWSHRSSPSLPGWISLLRLKYCFIRLCGTLTNGSPWRIKSGFRNILLLRI